MPPATRRRSNFLLTGLVLGLVGLGVRGQNVVHWFLFAAVIGQSCWRLYGALRNFQMYLVHIGEILFCISCLSQIVLCVKRAKLLRQLVSNSRKLTRKNYLIIRLADAVIFFLVVSQFAQDMNNYVWKGCFESFHLEYSHINRNSTVANVKIAAVCIHRYLLVRYSDMFCGLYLLIFLIIYFIKVQQLSFLASKIRSSGWKEKVWAISPEVFAIYEKLEDSSSMILFFRAVFQFVCIINMFRLLMINIKTRSHLGFQGIFFRTFNYCQNIFITVSLLLSISLMQEDIEQRCRRISELILFGSFTGSTPQENWIIQCVMKSSFTQKVTIGKMAEVSRGIIITLASSWFSPFFFGKSTTADLASTTFPTERNLVNWITLNLMLLHIRRQSSFPKVTIATRHSLHHGARLRFKH